MPEDNAGEAGQVPAAPAGAVEPTPTVVENTDLKPAVDPVDPRITRANGEAASERVKRKELETKLSTLEATHAAKLAEAADAALAAKKEVQDAKAEVAAAKLGLVDADAAKKLLNWDVVAAGKTIEEAMSDLVTEKPWLLAKPVAQAPNLSPTNPSSNGPRLTAADLKTMTRSEIQALPEPELFEALSRV